MFLLSNKPIPDLYEFHKVVKAAIPQFMGFLKEGSEIWVDCPIEFQEQIEAMTPPGTPLMDIVKQSISSARVFGSKLIVEFAAENVVMGITQDNMTNQVRKACSEVVNCLVTGSLYDAIKEIKQIPAESKDPKYLTNPRLIQFCNKIEAYLGIPLTTEMNE